MPRNGTLWNSGFDGCYGHRIVMKLASHENELVGQWSFSEGRMLADETEQRIGNLISNHLVEVARGNWRVLYRDPESGDLWELTYPHGEMQGGGPRCLTKLQLNEALRRYELRS